MMPVGFISCHYSCAVRANLCTHMKLRWFLFNNVFSPLHVYSRSALFVLGHLLKTETVLKVARLHFHQQIQICVFYRSQFLFPILPSNRSKLQQRLRKPIWHFFFSWIKITPGRSGGRSPSDMLCFVLPVPSHPNAVIGIPASSPQIRHNIDVSFSFTPHSQTLPYKYSKEN